MLGLGVGAATVAGTGLVAGQALADELTVEAAKSPQQAAQFIKAVFDSETKNAGGWWRAVITVAGQDGEPVGAVDQDADTVLEAWSTNKVAVAVAVLDKVDRGELTVDHLLDVTDEIVSKDGDGIFGYDDAYPSHVTLGHALANMLTVSDNTAVRLCGKVISADEINTYLASKGFPNTRVERKEDIPDQFWLGKTTPREQHGLLQALAKGELLSKESTQRILTLMRTPVAFTDGIRLRMSTNERLQIATKAGWLDDEVDERCEIGIMFDDTDAPILTYSIYAGGQGALEDFGATHPAIRARANMGWAFNIILDAVRGAKADAAPGIEYEPGNG